MPNWCQNNVTFSHTEKAMIDKIYNAADDGKLFRSFIPVPQQLSDTINGYLGDDNEQQKLLEQQALNTKQYGYPTWYEFCLSEWGTKWDASDLEINDLYDNNPDDIHHITLSFSTAWSPPIEFYETLIDQLGFEIEATYYEGGCGFCGRYVNGTNTEYTWNDLKSARQNIPVDLDEEYCITEMLEEYEEDEE